METFPGAEFHSRSWFIVRRSSLMSQTSTTQLKAVLLKKLKQPLHKCLHVISDPLCQPLVPPFFQDQTLTLIPPLPIMMHVLCAWPHLSTCTVCAYVYYVALHYLGSRYWDDNPGTFSTVFIYVLWFKQDFSLGSPRMSNESKIQHYARFTPMWINYRATLLTLAPCITSFCTVSLCKNSHMLFVGRSQLRKASCFLFFAENIFVVFLE